MISIVPPFKGQSYLVQELKGLSKGEIVTLSRIGFSAGLSYFNGNYGPLQRHLRERTDHKPRVANMGRISAKAGLWTLAALLEDVQLQRAATFSEKPPTPAEVTYQIMQDEGVIWTDRFSGLLQRCVASLRQQLPGIFASPYPPKANSPKESAPVNEKPQKIEIVGMPEQKTAITSMPSPGRLSVDIEKMPSPGHMTVDIGKMPEQPRPLRARQTVEHHPNSQEITATVTTYEYADTSKEGQDE